MRSLAAPICASVAGHLLLVFIAQRAPGEVSARRKNTVPLVVHNRPPPPKPKVATPPFPPPEPKRVVHFTPKRLPRPIAFEPPQEAKAAPPPPGFSVDTKSTVGESSVAVPAKEGGGNPFADPSLNLKPGDKVAVRQPPPPSAEPIEPATWLTEAADRSPPYPSAALRNDIEGQVLLRVCVGVSGAVESVQVLRGLGFGCDEAATSWAKQRWRFRPARRGGRPVPSCLIQPMRFQLQR